jgi:hypothetical protein
MRSGLEATEINGITTETPAVSTSENIIAIKRRSKRYTFRLLSRT